MYITPNTDIFILSCVPLDESYNNTIYFGEYNDATGKTKQENFFRAFKKYQLERQNYQRAERGWLRVNILADNLYDCNYMMFRNTSFGQKWFYAFIKTVKYINNAVSEIEYEIDVIQTWHFDYQLEMCFVEREHTTTDNIGENTVPENLETGEYIINNRQIIDCGGMHACILVTEGLDDDGNEVTIQMFNSNDIVMGLGAYFGTLLDVANKIAQYVNAGKENAIVAAFEYPDICHYGVATSSTERRFDWQTATTKMPTTFGESGGVASYTPKNKKLYTYPYQMCLLSNQNGSNVELHYELFYDQSAIEIDYCGNPFPSPQTIAVPKNYGWLQHSHYDRNHNYQITNTNFPVIAFAGDTFKAWWAQNKFNIVTGLLTTVVGLATAPVAPTIGTGAAISGVGQIASILGQAYQHSVIPNTSHGNTNDSALNTAMDRTNFEIYHMQIKREFAEIIDDYFTKYGYAVHRLKVPNRSARPNWTYCKTVGCSIKGVVTANGRKSIPSDDAEKICKIYDNGITWWKDGLKIGDYSYDNSPS